LGDPASAELLRGEPAGRHLQAWRRSLQDRREPRGRTSGRGDGRPFEFGRQGRVLQHDRI